MSSQRLKCQSHYQHGSVPGSLNICYDCYLVVLVGVGVSLPVLETLFHLLSALSNVDMRAFALTYCILFCFVLFGWYLLGLVISWRDL